MERYIKEDLNPQGLRIQVLPNLWELNPEFKKQWKTNLQECTIKMMNALISHYNEDIRNIDRDIIEFQRLNVALCAHPTFQEKDKSLKEHIAKIL